MKKYLFIISLLLLTAMSTVSAKAVTVDPDSYTPTAGATMIFKLYASPPVGSAALQLRLGAVGATITDYELPVSGSLLSLGCEGSLNFSADSVCVDFASQTGTIEEGTYLGQITLEFDSAQGLLYKKSDNAYVVGASEFQTDFGALAGDESLLPAQVALTATPAPTPVGEAVGPSDDPGIGSTASETPWLTYALYGVGALLLLGSVVTILVLVRKSKSGATPSPAMPVSSAPVPDSGMPPLPPLPDLPAATAAPTATPNSDLSPLDSGSTAASPMPVPASAPPVVAENSPTPAPQPDANSNNGLPPLPQV